MLNKNQIPRTGDTGDSVDAETDTDKPLLPENHQASLENEKLVSDENRLLEALKTGLNRGGRPRKDGTRKDTRPTLASLGYTKGQLYRLRRFTSYSHEDFDAALAKKRSDLLSGRRVRSFVNHYLPDRQANLRPQREARANLSRLFSTLRRIRKDHEFDASEHGQRIVELAEMTTAAWIAALTTEEE